MLPEPQKSLDELISIYRDDIENKYEQAIKDTVEYVQSHPNNLNIVNFSGGKDSLVVWEMWKEVLTRLDFEPEWVVNFANTSNDTADTYKYIKHTIPADKLKILNPEIGFYTWIKDNNYYLPDSRVRSCCSTYKEGQVYSYYDKERDTTDILGVRKYESAKRANYQMIMDSTEWTNTPKHWVKFAPIIEFTDMEIWLLILMKNWEFNNMYRYGFHRVGCLMCPYQSEYVDLLIEEHYPKGWERWLKILEINYDSRYVGSRLHWTLEEWQQGKWKDGIRKTYEIINKKPTPERVKQLAELLGISEEMAAKYFKRVCECGKKCTPTEIAMFYKTQGRFEGQDDNRTVLCTKCLCKLLNISKKEYLNMAKEFKEQGCNLF